MKTGRRTAAPSSSEAGYFVFAVLAAFFAFAAVVGSAFLVVLADAAGLAFGALGAAAGVAGQQHWRNDVQL